MNRDTYTYCLENAMIHKEKKIDYNNKNFKYSLHFHLPLWI